MSQEAEYFLRDISYRQAENLARRIAREERREAVRRTQDLLRREVQRVEGRMQGEVSGLRQECLRRNADIQKQLECNRKLTDALKDRAAQQDQRLEAHERALRVLTEHDEELRRSFRRTLRGLHNWLSDRPKRKANSRRRSRVGGQSGSDRPRASSSSRTLQPGCCATSTGPRCRQSGWRRI